MPGVMWIARWRDEYVAARHVELNDQMVGPSLSDITVSWPIAPNIVHYFGGGQHADGRRFFVSVRFVCHHLLISPILMVYVMHIGIMFDSSAAVHTCIILRAIEAVLASASANDARRCAWYSSVPSTRRNCGRTYRIEACAWQY